MNKNPIPVALLVHHLASGGLERVVVNLLRHLDRRRFRPILIIQNRRGAMLARVPEDVTVHDLDGLPTLRAPRVLSDIMEQHAVRVAYAGTRPTNLALVRAARRMKEPPAVVVSEHTPIRSSLAERRWRLFYKLAMRYAYVRAERIVVPTEEVGRELSEVLQRHDLPLVELRNPVFAPDELPTGDAEVVSNLLVAAGRLVPAKGFDLLLRALAELDDLKLELLGDGPEREALDQLARELGIADRVSFVGEVADPYRRIRRAAAFVLSSRHEGPGNVLVEAMALGVPVVATDCDHGPRVILDDGKAGILVQPENPAAIADGIRRAVADRDRLASAARMAAERYSVASTVPGYASLFEELAS